ncbi:MAG: tRNA pseudouridine(55) synthase TruB [Armatimonadota bacterium]
MDGILVVNKPAGPTSHDVVAKVRRVFHQKRVGHAGTLDPPASGVLVVCLGAATRLVEYLMELPKRYRAVAVFGVETESEDATGNVIREIDCSHITEGDLAAVLPRFTGEIEQVPPMVSAVHHEGKRLYELARAGKTVERTPRKVHIYSLTMSNFTPGEHPSVELDVECSKGTYIRTLCADIGQALGCGAHMSKLVRTAVGNFTLEDAVSLEDLEGGNPERFLRPMDEAVSHLPVVRVGADEAERLANGVAVPGEGEGLVRVYADGFIAIGMVSAGMIRPEKVFARGL